MKTNKRIPVEVYSRVVGYYRPVNQWNKGKQEEFRERKTFLIKDASDIEKNTGKFFTMKNILTGKTIGRVYAKTLEAAIEYFREINKFPSIYDKIFNV